MRSKRRTYLHKAIGAAILAGLIGVPCGWILWEFHTRDQPDHGARPLIIIATTGGGKKINMTSSDNGTTGHEFFYRHSGHLATYFEGEEVADDYSPIEGGYGAWVGECSMRASAVWAGYSGDIPTRSASATLLAPQFNFTSIEEATDVQSDLQATLRVDRADGAVLAEGYPSPKAKGDSWFTWYTTTWQGVLGGEGNYAFTDQPTLLFTNRDASRSDQIGQLLAGLGMGLALTLIVRAASDFIDAGDKE